MEVQLGRRYKHKELGDLCLQCLVQASTFHGRKSPLKRRISKPEVAEGFLEPSCNEGCFRYPLNFTIGPMYLPRRCEKFIF